MEESVGIVKLCLIHPSPFKDHLFRTVLIQHLIISFLCTKPRFSWPNSGRKNAIIFQVYGCGESSAGPDKYVLGFVSPPCSRGFSQGPVGRVPSQTKTNFRENQRFL